MHRSRNVITTLSLLVIGIAIFGWSAAWAEHPHGVPANDGVFAIPTPQPTPRTDYAFRPRLSIPSPSPRSDVKALRDAKNFGSQAGGVTQDVSLTAGRAVQNSTADDAPLLSDVPEGVINVVLLGADKRPKWGAWRTDTIIVVSINPEAKSVGMLSIPRDLWVEIPGVGVGRINTVDFIGERYDVENGGPGLLKRTIETNLGLPVHRYARIDLEGFVQVIDALGGVTLNVECPIQDAFLDESLTGEDGLTEFSLDVGVHHLDGLTALRYARSRRAGTDFDRHERQQHLLRSLAEQNLDWTLLPKLPRLWETLSNTVQTDLTLSEMIKLASFGMGIQQNRIKSRFIDWGMTENFVTAGGAMVLLPNDETLPQAVEEFLNPPDEDRRLELEQAQVEILNGTNSADLATIAVDRLQRKGIDATAGGTTSHFRKSIVVINRSVPHTLDVIQSTLRLDPDAAIRSPEPLEGADLQVILGDDWQPCP